MPRFSRRGDNRITDYVTAAYRIERGSWGRARDSRDSLSRSFSRRDDSIQAGACSWIVRRIAAAHAAAIFSLFYFCDSGEHMECEGDSFTLGLPDFDPLLSVSLPPNAGPFETISPGILLYETMFTNTPPFTLTRTRAWSLLPRIYDRSVKILFLRFDRQVTNPDRVV